MSDLDEKVRRAREDRDWAPLVKSIPYAQFLGLDIERVDGELLGRMHYADHLIGNSLVSALHGGTIGALLEWTGILKVIIEVETPQVPKTINITVEYLRTGRAQDVWACAELTKLGRRVANIRVMAWQEDRDRPIAAANMHLLLAP